jgi:hypothetical protein
MRVFSCLFIIFLSSNLLSQQISLPDLPTKDGKIYYVFKTNLSNEKKCLKEYHFLATRKFTDRIKQQMKGRYDKVYDNQNLVLFSASDKVNNYNSPKNTCIDTLETGLFFFIIPKTINYFDLTVLGLVSNLAKPKVLTSQITAEPYLIFNSKNQYELRFRKFMLKLTLMDGSTTDLDLSQYYNELKNKEKLTKNDVQLFLELNEILELTNKVYSECLKFEYENEELD